MTTPGRGNAVEYQKVVEIDGEEYKIVTFGPSRAFMLAARLTKFLGEPFAAMAAAGGDASKAVEGLPLAIRALCANLNERAVLDLVKEILTSANQHNKPVDFEEHFQGRLGHMVKVVSKVVEVQFADFFSELGQSLSEGLGEKKKEKAPE